MNINWPKSKDRPDRAPWYLILWMCIWAPLVLVSVLLLCFSVFMSYGKTAMLNTWDSVW